MMRTPRPPRLRRRAWASRFLLTRSRRLRDSWTRWSLKRATAALVRQQELLTLLRLELDSQLLKQVELEERERLLQRRLRETELSEQMQQPQPQLPQPPKPEVLEPLSLETLLGPPPTLRE